MENHVASDLAETVIWQRNKDAGLGEQMQYHVLAYPAKIYQTLSVILFQEILPLEESLPFRALKCGDNSVDVVVGHCYSRHSPFPSIIVLFRL